VATFQQPVRRLGEFPPENHGRAYSFASIGTRDRELVAGV
jgi:hypothetical protein